MSGSGQISAIFAAVVLSIAALGIFAICFIAARGILGPNSMAGLRTRAMLSSEDAWQTGHRAALPVMAVAAAIAIISAVSSVFLIGDVSAYIAAILVAVVVLLVGVVTATLVGGRAARRVLS